MPCCSPRGWPLFGDTSTRTKTQPISLRAGRSGLNSEMPKVVLENRNPRVRAQQRQALGTLKELTVQPATRARYDKALTAFLQFLQQNQLKLPFCRDKIDPLAAEYMEHLWVTGAGRGLASDTLAALQDQDPRLKGQLQLSWRLLKTWHTHEIPSRAPPFPEYILHCLVGWALTKHNFNFAVSLLVGFYAILRTGELLAIQRRHISFSVQSGVAVITLGFTKGGKRMGVAESVTLTHDLALRFLRQWMQLTSDTQGFCSSPAQWRATFSQGLQELKLSDFEFRPYSLRRGGATWYFSKYNSLDRVMVMGRWQAARTARIYLNESLATLAEMHFKPHNVRLSPFHLTFKRTDPSCYQTLEPPKGRLGGRGKKAKKAKQRNLPRNTKPMKAKKSKK